MTQPRRSSHLEAPIMALRYSFAAILLATLSACASSTTTSGSSAPSPRLGSTEPPSPDPRIGLRAGMFDAAEAAWNLRVVSETRPSARFIGTTNSDLAFLGKYVIQGSYNGWQIWNISNPKAPKLETAYFCPASQSDV